MGASRPMACPVAPVVIFSVMRPGIDQPAAFLENASMAAARQGRPSLVGTRVMPPTRSLFFWSTANARPAIPRRRADSRIARDAARRPLRRTPPGLLALPWRKYVGAVGATALAPSASCVGADGAIYIGINTTVHGDRVQRGHRGLRGHGQELFGLLPREAGVQDAQERAVREAPTCSWSATSSQPPSGRTRRY